MMDTQLLCVDNRQIDRLTERQMDLLKGGMVDRQIDRQIERERDGEKKKANREKRERKIDREVERYQRWIYREGESQRERQRD